MPSEKIIYKGIVFRRYPNSKKRTERVYFVPSVEKRQAGIGRLHQEIYKDNFGPIPEGFVVHHKNNN
jgi:hypothetical protein